MDEFILISNFFFIVVDLINPMIDSAFEFVSEINKQN